MHPTTDTLISLALEEDLKDIGDITANCFVDADARAIGNIVSRADGVLAGEEVAAAVFQRVDENLKITSSLGDGAVLKKGTVAMTIEGPARALLTAERTALNFLQRLSGTASLTAQFVAFAEPHGVKILDTRKTTPGWRHLEKAAVVAGGGTNHRMGLYDMAMVKDNHLLSGDTSEDLQEGVLKLRAKHPQARVELESDTLEQVARFLNFEGVDVIMLDNMSNESLREAVAMNVSKGKPVQLEASGGVNLDTVEGIAETGVDFISVGALTHSAGSLDLGMDFVPQN